MIIKSVTQGKMIEKIFKDLNDIFNYFYKNN